MSAALQIRSRRWSIWAATALPAAIACSLAGRWSLTGANASHAGGRVTVSNWRIDRVRLPPGNVLTLPPSPDQRAPARGGLSGSDKLSRFGSLVIDYTTGQLILLAR